METTVEPGASISVYDFIDVALVIMAETKNRDILDFYLSLWPLKISEENMQGYLENREFLITGYENLAKDMDELREVLKEMDKWV